MSFKKMNNLKVSAFAVVLSVGILSGYSTLDKNVTLVVNGEEKHVSTFKTNVQEVLDAHDIKYDGNDIVTAKLDDKVASGDKIKVIKVEEKTCTEFKKIPYDTTVLKDENCISGNTEVTREGKDGQKQVSYKMTYHDGKLVEKAQVDEKVISNPEDKIVKEVPDVQVASNEEVSTSRGVSSRGASEKAVSAARDSASAKTSTSQKGRTMTVQATAYVGDTITSTGTRPKWGTIAVDPRVIPYGTKVYIPQFDMVFTAEDCGGAIKGNIIDIFMTSTSQMNAWGRKTINIQILN
ncbi:MAG: G5 domain-containing protein [Clostridioides sp.]|jgi:3D (Asp-Asp-Asp) domain-containing protein|nr:G5 domain-containing protein [Clostridioides sp.]